MQGILLAAGFGKRYQTETAPNQDKLLTKLPNQQTVLLQSASALIKVLPNSIAVLQPNQTARQSILKDLGFQIIESKAAKEGMGYAIADAINHSKQAKGWLIALADMPWISEDLISILCEKIVKKDAIVAPRFAGKRGQPVAFGAAWGHQLSTLQGDEGARAILKRATISWVDWHDDSIHKDIDLPSDLAHS